MSDHNTESTTEELAPKSTASATKSKSRLRKHFIAAGIVLLVLALIPAGIYGNRWYSGRKHMDNAQKRLVIVKAKLEEFKKIRTTSSSETPDPRLEALASEIGRGDTYIMAELDSAKKHNLKITAVVRDFCDSLEEQIVEFNATNLYASKAQASEIWEAAEIVEKGIAEAMKW